MKASWLYASTEHVAPPILMHYYKDTPEWVYSVGFHINEPQQELLEPPEGHTNNYSLYTLIEELRLKKLSMKNY